jgi:hypothetical protein
VIYVGIDDTDTVNSPGTNQLARALVARVAPAYRCAFILRHQLLDDPRVPYTSKNGSASIHLEPSGCPDVEALTAELRAGMRAWFKEGSDPGLCVALRVPAEVTAFGRRCQAEFVRQAEARRLAADCGLHLEGLGGTEDGVIGALAAVGLAACGDDGRVVQLGTWADDLSGPQEVSAVWARGVEVREVGSGERVSEGTVDVGKHLRPNRRASGVVMFVTPSPTPTDGAPAWQAVRLP